MQTAGLFAAGATDEAQAVVYALKSLPVFAGRSLKQERTKPNAFNIFTRTT